MTIEIEVLALNGEAIYLRYGSSCRKNTLLFELFANVHSIAPNNVRAVGILAEKYSTRVTGTQSVDRDADIRRSDEFASRALSTDPKSYHARHAKARVLWRKSAYSEDREHLALRERTYESLARAGMQKQ